MKRIRLKRYKKPLLIAGSVLLGSLGFALARQENLHKAEQTEHSSATTEPEVVSEVPTVQAPETPVVTPKAFSKTQYSLTDPKSIWIIANKQRPLNPLTYAPSDLVSVGGGQQMRQEASLALSELFMAAQAAGHQINPLSGYRSYARQQVVYQNVVDTYGQAEADAASAKPGHSEHQTGFAIDVGGGGCGIEDCFANTPEGKWLAANAYKYGYVIRYPSGKQAVTGYKYEPWHIRYVGKSLSAEMQKQNIVTLEEFFGL